MEDRQNNTPSNKEAGSCTRSIAVGLAPFVVGLVAALVFGWCIFPDMIFEKNEQPVAFSHKTHLTKAALDCTACHALREDGTFYAIPSTADCATCHSKMMGTTQTEKDYVDNYVKTGKEVKWLKHQVQPDNVFFSHSAHSLRECNTCHTYTNEELCHLCHTDIGTVYRENRLTGYSDTTIKMWQCERCHANVNHLGSTDASNACFTCHK